MLPCQPHGRDSDLWRKSVVPATGTCRWLMIWQKNCQRAWVTRWTVSGSLFMMASLSFRLVPVIFWAILYFLAQENVPSSSCNFPASSWEPAVSLRGSREESDIWKLKSEYFLAYCFWAVIICRPSRVQRWNIYTCKRVCVFVFVCVPWLQLFLSLFIFLRLMNLHWYLHSIRTSRLFLAFPLSLYVTSFSVNKKVFFHYFRYVICALHLSFCK